MSNFKKSNATKRLQGTYRKDRDIKATAGDRLVEIPQAPDTLSQGARQEWQALAPVLVELGTICRGDLRAFEQLCETLASANFLQEVIQAEGPILKTGTGSYKSHPALRSLETARSQSTRLFELFGMTPRSRSYVSAAPAATDEKESGFRSLRR